MANIFVPRRITALGEHSNLHQNGVSDRQVNALKRHYIFVDLHLLIILVQALSARSGGAFWGAYAVGEIDAEAV
jgi:hypothetical protein